ncbi:MAG TPA: hypothetical protein VLC09_04220, partial [Polyangiaceae bacterium]|nr:hypothetical protein [Polyangiaceae bacterium]
MASGLACSTVGSDGGPEDGSDDAAVPDGGDGSTGDGDDGGAGGDGGSGVDVASCDEPEPWAAPEQERVIGEGSAASCDEAALRAALAEGGNVTFDCGDEPVVIAVTSEIEIHAPTVLDGEDRVTLDGGDANRILVVASNSSLSVRRLRFVHGKAQDTMEPEGIGGAVAGNWRSKVEVI